MSSEDSDWTPEQQLSASAFSAASWLILSSASADRRVPHRQLHLTLLAVSVLSLDQRLVSQPLASHAVNETVEPRQGVVLDVAFVQAERKFINVTVQMLFAGVVIDAINSALHDRKHAFNPVGGHAIADVFALAVIDRIVIEGQAGNADIRAGFVCVDGRANFDILKDCGLDRLRIRSGDRHGDRSAAALAHTENWRLSDCPASGMELLALMLIGFFAADERFIKSMMPASFLRSEPPQASRSRCKTNQADFWVIPISLASCIEEMPLRAVTSRYIA